MSEQLPLFDDARRAAAEPPAGGTARVFEVTIGADDHPDITAAQRRLPFVVEPRTRAEYRVRARWWELEARRGYGSSKASLRYAQNMRWAAELAGLYGPGTWRELLQRSGHPNPEPADEAKGGGRGG